QKELLMVNKHRALFSTVLLISTELPHCPLADLYCWDSLIDTMLNAESLQALPAALCQPTQWAAGLLSLTYDVVPQTQDEIADAAPVPFGKSFWEFWELVKNY